VQGLPVPLVTLSEVNPQHASLELLFHSAASA
jgi:hypothetical protein